MNKTQRIIFASSLLLNTLLIGVIGGHVASTLLAPKPKPIWEAKSDLINKLPEDKAKLVSHMFQSSHEHHRKMKKLLQQQQQEIINILTAPTFNPSQYDQAALSLHQIHGKRIEEMREATKQIAAQLDQQQRIQFAHFLQSISNHQRPQKYTVR